MNSILSATVLIPLIVIVLLIVLLCVGYVKAPPDMAYIISGVKKKSKVVIGKASIRIPFFERLDKLNLRLIPIDVKTSNAVPTADYININVDATVNIKISNDPEKLRLAAENFLNKNTEYIAGVAREVLEGNVREIVGKMKLERMVPTARSLPTWSRKMRSRILRRWDSTSSALMSRILWTAMRSLKIWVLTTS